MNEKFSVWQFFHDGSTEEVRHGVGPEAAVVAAHHYCHSVATQLGLVDRVIIVDDDDYTVFEWLRGQGVTFPPQVARRA